MFNFEKLEVWQKAIDFADLVYRETQTLSRRRTLRANESDAARGGLSFFESGRRLLPHLAKRLRSFR